MRPDHEWCFPASEPGARPCLDIQVADAHDLVGEPSDPLVARLAMGPRRVPWKTGPDASTIPSGDQQQHGGAPCAQGPCLSSSQSPCSSSRVPRRLARCKLMRPPGGWSCRGQSRHTDPYSAKFSRTVGAMSLEPKTWDGQFTDTAMTIRSRAVPSATRRRSSRCLVRRSSAEGGGRTWRK